MQRILKVEKDISIPWFEQIKKTVILPGQSERQTFYSIKPPDYVTILAETKEKKIVIVKQYRPAVEDYTFELPSGHVEKEEMPSQAIMRELREETGFITNDVTFLGELIPDTGRVENRLWAFYTDSLETKQVSSYVDNDGIEVDLVSIDKLQEMIKNGSFKHALDLSVIALAMLKKNII